jgi:hypothetical protein
MYTGISLSIASIFKHDQADIKAKSNETRNESHHIQKQLLDDEFGRLKINVDPEKN